MNGPQATRRGKIGPALLRQKKSSSGLLPWRLDWLVLINIVLMLVYHLTGVGALGVLGNVISAGTILYLIVFILSEVALMRRYGFLLLLFLLPLIGTLAFNLGRTDPVDVLKFVSLFVLYFAALGSRQKLECSRYMAAALLIIPLLLVPIGSRVYVEEAFGDASFSYFQTRNAAVLYFTAVYFYLWPSLRRLTLPMQLMTAILFGKIGAILATGISYAVWNVKLSGRSLGLLVLGFFLVFIAFQLGALNRISTTMGPLWRDLTTLGPIRIAHMSFGEIVQRAGTTDISGYFRIKHWVDIWDRYASGDFAHIMFGYGPGQTKYTSEIRLVPHNDYLRIIVEYGIFNFISFLVLLFFTVKNMNNSVLKTMIGIYIIYSFTDNMMDNFSSMMLLFGGAGLYARAKVMGNAGRRVPSATLGPVRASPAL